MAKIEYTPRIPVNQGVVAVFQWSNPEGFIKTTEMPIAIESAERLAENYAIVKNTFMDDAEDWTARAALDGRKVYRLFPVTTWTELDALWPSYVSGVLFWPYQMTLEHRDGANVSDITIDGRWVW